MLLIKGCLNYTLISRVCSYERSFICPNGPSCPIIINNMVTKETAIKWKIYQ